MNHGNFPALPPTRSHSFVGTQPNTTAAAARPPLEAEQGLTRLCLCSSRSLTEAVLKLSALTIYLHRETGRVQGLGADVKYKLHFHH